MVLVAGNMLPGVNAALRHKHSSIRMNLEFIEIHSKNIPLDWS